jgi:hypothetical protein
MASKSEATYGAKLANAQKIETQLKGNPTYVAPVPELTTNSLSELIVTLTTSNIEVASLIAGYSKAVDVRQKAFRKDADSVYKLLSPMGAAVRAAYGKESKEAVNVGAMVKTMRGIRLKKAAATAQEKTISQSEVSYGSMAKAFSDIVTTLGTYTTYKPVNEKISMKALEGKVASLTTISNDVTTAYSKLKPVRDGRMTDYKLLSARIQRIKDAVKSQYGNKSSEYAQMKGLKV